MGMNADIPSDAIIFILLWSEVLFMVFLAKDVKNGKVYLYIRHNYSVNGKSKRAWQVALGPEDTLKTSGNIALDLGVHTETLEFGLVAALLRTAEKLKLVEVVNRAAGKRVQGWAWGNTYSSPPSTGASNPFPRPSCGGGSSRRSSRRSTPTCPQAWMPVCTGPTSATSQTRLSSKWRTMSTVPSWSSLACGTTTSYSTPRTSSRTSTRGKKTRRLPATGTPRTGDATLNLVNVSLFCALDAGVPLLHLVYPGNVQDASHFKDVALKHLARRLKDLGIPDTRVTLAFDKGNLSEEAFATIEREQLDYIASDRPSSHKDLRALPPESFEMYMLPNGKVVGVLDARAEKYGQERRFVVVYNPEEAAWKRENLEEKVQKKTSELQAFFASRLNTTRWSDPAKVQAKCARVLGKKYATLVAAEVSGEVGNLALTVAPVPEAVAAAAQNYGKSFLMTSREDLPAADVASAYRQQYLVERAFTWSEGRRVSRDPPHVPPGRRKRARPRVHVLRRFALAVPPRERTHPARGNDEHPARDQAPHGGEGHAHCRARNE